MRKGLNKKGFSLVELMMVVVIMGILIAVAIPLYGAITDNAEKKTCGSNQQMIREMFARYCVSDANRTSATLLPNGSYDAKNGSDSDIDTSFFVSFDGDELPECPIEGHYYVITAVRDLEIKIECHNPDGSLCTEHNE